MIYVRRSQMSKQSRGGSDWEDSNMGEKFERRDRIEPRPAISIVDDGEQGTGGEAEVEDPFLLLSEILTCIRRENRTTDDYLKRRYRQRKESLMERLLL